MNKILMLNDYEKIGEIKKCLISNFFLVLNKSNNKHYLAKINWISNPNENPTIDDEYIITIKRQLLFHRTLVNPAIVKFKGYSPIDFDGNENFVLVTKLMKNDCLSILFKNLRKNAKLVKGWNNTKMIINILGISLGLKFMHDNHIVHRDVKPSNVLLDSKFYPKLTGFSTSRHISKSDIDLTNLVGTPYYMAPEVAGDDIYSFKIDVFSFGMILYEFYTGKIPIVSGKTDYRIIKNIVRGERPNISKMQDGPIKDLIEQCWSKESDKRPSFEDIIEKFTIDRKDFWPEDVDEEEVENYLHKFGLSLDPDAICAYFISKAKRNSDDDDSEDSELNDDDDDDTDTEIRLSDFYIEKLKCIEEQLKNRKVTHFNILDEETIKELKKGIKIGSGSSSRVFEVIKSNSEPEIFVLKEMKKNSLSIENIKRFVSEYEMMVSMNHPNIMKAFGIFLNSRSKLPPSILLEHCSMNLATAIKYKLFTNERIVTSIYEIAEGMKYVHSKEIIHLDLKPTNILVGDDGKIKIGDFGISQIKSFDISSSTQQMKAPEMNKSADKYDEKVDVYSFGIVVFFILSGGKLPKIKKDNKEKGENAEFPKNFTDFSVRLINECLSFNPKDRPSFEEILGQMAEYDYRLIEINEDEHGKIVAFINNQNQ